MSECHSLAQSRSTRAHSDRWLQPTFEAIRVCTNSQHPLIVSENEWVTRLEYFIARWNDTECGESVRLNAKHTHTHRTLLECSFVGFYHIMCHADHVMYLSFIICWASFLSVNRVDDTQGVNFSIKIKSKRFAHAHLQTYIWSRDACKTRHSFNIRTSPESTNSICLATRECPFTALVCKCTGNFHLLLRWWWWWWPICAAINLGHYSS